MERLEQFTSPVAVPIVVVDKVKFAESEVSPVISTHAVRGDTPSQMT